MRLKMCWATIGVEAAKYHSWTEAFWLNVIWTVCESSAVTELNSVVPVVGFFVQNPLVSNAGYCFIRLKVYTTSAAVKGVPSLHFTSLRSLKVTWVKLSFQVADVASQGFAGVPL